MQEFGTGTGWLKAGFLGFGGSGKTWTSMVLACGVRDYFGLSGPIAMYDTETGSEYIAGEVFKRTGRKLKGTRSRNFDELVKFGRECIEEGVSVAIVDSITHPWRELCDSYLAQVNEMNARKNPPRGKQLRLEFQDWNKIKPKWAIWTDFYLNSPLHVIIAGRAGFEYDFEDRDDDSGKKDLVKTGIKMKTENEFGFEPSLLVQMVRDQEVQGSVTKITRRAIVLKDRFNVIDGAECANPDFEFFRPHVEMLNAGAHATVDTKTQSDFALDADGDDAHGRERKARVILCERVQAAIVDLWPGQTAREKKAKQDAIRTAFGTPSWTEIETKLDSAALRRGLEEIEKMRAEPAGEVA